MSRVARSIKKEHYMTEVVDLYLQGNSQSQICKQFKERGTPISVSSVSNYIAQARQEWRVKRMDDMEIIIQAELKKLDQMEAEAAALFGKFNPETTEFDETFDSSKEANEWVKTRLKIMEQRHKLLGLYKPVKIDVESKNVNINADAESIAATRSEILRRLSPKFV
jgi:small-conductance mechanosensitive channel